MKREFKEENNLESPGDNDFEFTPDFEEEDCPYADIMMSLMFQDKPFGMMWTRDNVNMFLKARGYKLLDRKNKQTGEEYVIAVKQGSSNIPDEGHSNVKEMFDSEMQEIILKWVLRIARENEMSDKNDDSTKS